MKQNHQDVRVTGVDIKDEEEINLSACFDDMTSVGMQTDDCVSSLQDDKHSIAHDIVSKIPDVLLYLKIAGQEQYIMLLLQHDACLSTT